MALDVEAWIGAVHQALPQAQFVSLEPDDGRNALLAAYWQPAGSPARLITYANLPFAKPEFILDVEVASDEEASEWALAALQFADDHRHLSDLVPGALFASSGPLVDFSPLDGWVVGLAEQVDEAGLPTPHLRLFAIYASEIEVLKVVGLAAFLRRLGAETSKPYRLAITKEPR